MKITKEQQEASLTLNSFLSTVLNDDVEGMKALLDQFSPDESFQTLVSSIFIMKAILDLADLELQERAGIALNYAEMVKANAEMILDAEVVDDEE